MEFSASGWALISLIFLFIGMMLFFSITDKKLLREAVEKDEKWLKDEMAKPHYSIRFVLMDGTTLSSGPFEPYMDLPGSRWGTMMTSKQRASAVLESSYSRGFFRDENSTTYPACNVKQATIEA